MKRFKLFIIVAVAIIAIAGGVTLGSATTAFRARSNKAAKTIDGMIAQSKINAMSNRNNYFELYYDAEEDCYVCELVYNIYLLQIVVWISFNASYIPLYGFAKIGINRRCHIRRIFQQNSGIKIIAYRLMNRNAIVICDIIIIFTADKRHWSTTVK